MDRSKTVYLRRHRRRHPIPDRNGDPMESMGNLFDVAILIGVGFLIMALSSFGLNDILGKDDLTVVKNPGKTDMTIITREKGKIVKLQSTDTQAEGPGAAIGTVYRLETGQVVWVPESESTGN